MNRRSFLRGGSEFCADGSGAANLRAEGIPDSRIILTGTQW